MIAIQCPRCTQDWYSDEEDEGHFRPCSRCSDELKRKRGHRAEIDVPLLIAVAMCLILDVMLIALTALFPKVFGTVMLGLGTVMVLVGLVLLRILTRAAGGIFDTDREFD